MSSSKPTQVQVKISLSPVSKQIETKWRNHVQHMARLYEYKQGFYSS